MVQRKELSSLCYGSKRRMLAEVNNVKILKAKNIRR